MTNTTWKSIPATEACDLLDFWANAPWPMDMDQAHQYAAQLGWTVEEEDGENFLVNEVSGLTSTDVDTPVMPSGETASITFNITDYIRDVTDESKVFLNDQFTLYYREATARWGAGDLSTTEGNLRIAQWELGADKGRINIIESNKTIRANFDTPHYAKVLRELGE